MGYLMNCHKNSLENPSFPIDNPQSLMYNV